MKVFYQKAYTPRGFVSQRYSVFFQKDSGEILSWPGPKNDPYGYGGAEAKQLAENLALFFGCPCEEGAI